MNVIAYKPILSPFPAPTPRSSSTKPHDWKEGLVTSCWTETSEFCVDVVSQPGQSPLNITILNPSDIGALLNLTGTLMVRLDDGVGTCPP